LHSQIKENVWKPPHALKGSFDLIRVVDSEGWRFDADEPIMLMAVDVNVQYTSIQLERGMAKL
jgi:hypothetical protein